MHGTVNYVTYLMVFFFRFSNIIHNSFYSTCCSSRRSESCNNSYRSYCTSIYFIRYVLRRSLFAKLIWFISWGSFSVPTKKKSQKGFINGWRQLHHKHEPTHSRTVDWGWQFWLRLSWRGSLSRKRSAFFLKIIFDNSHISRIWRCH